MSLWLSRPLAHDQERRRRVRYLIRRNASVRNVGMTAAAVRGEHDKIRCLIDDRPRETSADIAAPKDEAADGDPLASDLTADAVEILLRDPLVAAHHALTQIQCFRFRRPDFGQLWHRDNVNQDNFSPLRLGQTHGQRNSTLRP